MQIYLIIFSGGSLLPGHTVCVCNGVQVCVCASGGQLNLPMGAIRHVFFLLHSKNYWGLVFFVYDAIYVFPGLCVMVYKCVCVQVVSTELSMVTIVHVFFTI